MAYKTTTVQTLVNEVKFFVLGAGQTSTALDTAIKGALDWTINDLCLTSELACFRKEGVLLLQSGTTDYPLPDDMAKIVHPSVKFGQAGGGTRWTLHYYDQQDHDRKHSDEALRNVTSQPTHFTVRGRDEDSGLWTLRVQPTPDQTYELLFSYFPMPQDLVSAALTDTLDVRFPPQMHRILSYGAVTQLPQYVSEATRNTLLGYYQEGKQKLGSVVSPVIGRVFRPRMFRLPRNWRSASPTLTQTLSGVDLTTP